jgi:hypothetical protein
MTNLSLLCLDEPSMTVETKHGNGGLNVNFKGTADLRVGASLQQLLQGLHDKALEIGVKEVTVDFCALEFMNSSCFKSFVTWLSLVQDLPDDRQYHIRFHSKPDILWQRRSLHALKCFADDLVSVES